MIRLIAPAPEESLEMGISPVVMMVFCHDLSCWKDPSFDPRERPCPSESI